MSVVTYTQVFKSRFDAGMYRQFIAQTYGAVFVFGGLNGIYNDAVKHAKALAKITGWTVEQVIDQAKVDFENQIEA